jgi:hypothetical protein
MSKFITLRAAQGHTFRYQRSQLGAVQTHSATFDAHMLDQLTEQQGAKQVRIYLGENEEGRLTFVLVGVDKHGKDILPGLVLNDPHLAPPAPGDEASPLLM